MSNIPVYWKTRLDEVEETLKLVKKGKVTKAADSAGGRPIYVVEYGKSNLKLGKSNCSSALGAHDITAYADKTGEDYIPTVFLVGCTHGGEFEGTVGLLNMIKVIETGTDYAGNRYDELAELSERVHLVLIPMVNPDGRSHIPFDSFVGKTFYDLRYYNQGTWKNGELCGWPGCKQKHPIKEYCDYLGGYFNDDGVNMMHEDYFSANVSSGTRLVLDVCRTEAPDISILLHGGTNCTNCLFPVYYISGNARKAIMAFQESYRELCDKNGVRYQVTPFPSCEEDPKGFKPFTLTSAMHHCSGEPAFTFESNQGLCDHGNIIYGYDEIYDSHMLLFAETIRFALKKYNKI